MNVQSQVPPSPSKGGMQVLVNSSLSGLSRSHSAFLSHGLGSQGSGTVVLDYKQGSGTIIIDIASILCFTSSIN